MYRGTRTRPPSLQCPMLHHHDPQKTQNHYAIPQTTKRIRSGVIYQISCPRCTACYVGQTSRHLQTRFREHTKNQGPVKTHLHQCNTTITEEHINILSSTSRGESHLLTLEALYIQELDPKINTKDEYRSRTLTIGHHSHIHGCSHCSQSCCHCRGLLHTWQFQFQFPCTQLCD